MRRCVHAVFVLCILALLGIAGCAASDPQWDPDAGGLSSARLLAMLKATDATEFKNVPVAEARERRNEALAALRKEAGGSQAADVLTDAFPLDTAGVPLYVGVGTFSGQPAYFVIEAYGAKGGKLDHKRLWVLSRSGTPLFSSTAR